MNNSNSNGNSNFNLNNIDDDIDDNIDNGNQLTMDLNIFNDSNDETILYPNLNDKKFNIKISNKKEFNDYKYDGTIHDVIEESEKLANMEFELAPYQIFVRNFMSSNTPYNSLLLYHGLGTGKTCTAITVAEDMRSYLNQINISQRIIVVASPNVQDNFKLQIFNEDKLNLKNGLWYSNSCIGNKLINEINPMGTKDLTKEYIIQQINKIIRSSYLFLGYIGDF